MSSSTVPFEDAARAAQEPLTATIRLEGLRHRPAAGLRQAAFLAALAGHLAVLYGVAREAPDPMAGGHGRLLDAVDITMVDSAVFEARREVSAPPAPAADRAVKAREGRVESKRGPHRPDQKEEKREPEKQPETPVRAEVVKTPSVAKQEDKERKEARTAADAGGATERGEALRPEKQSAPAAANPGAVHAYANAVVEALKRTKLKRVPGYGTIRVKLVVSANGGLASVGILKSSGNRRLDDAVLAEVRRAKLPVPPPGLSLKERWFEFTYKYVP